MKLSKFEQMKGKTVKEIREYHNFHDGLGLVMEFEDGDHVNINFHIRRGLGNSIEKRIVIG